VGIAAGVAIGVGVWVGVAVGVGVAVAVGVGGCGGVAGKGVIAGAQWVSNIPATSIKSKILRILHLPWASHMVSRIPIFGLNLFNPTSTFFTVD
jgi:hypothetical protein